MKSRKWQKARRQSFRSYFFLPSFALKKTGIKKSRETKWRAEGVAFLPAGKRKEEFWKAKNFSKKRMKTRKISFYSGLELILGSCVVFCPGRGFHTLHLSIYIHFDNDHCSLYLFKLLQQSKFLKSRVLKVSKRFRKSVSREVHENVHI